MAGPLIVTADFAPPDFAWLEGLRRTHYPAEHNRVPVHLTMFQGLPPSAIDDVRRQLAMHAAGPPPKATVAGLMNFGSGVAFRLVSDALEEIRGSIADHFHGLLCGPDASGWRPHITIQTRFQPGKPRSCSTNWNANSGHVRSASQGFRPHRYRGGPWETVATYRFRG